MHSDYDTYYEITVQGKLSEDEENFILDAVGLGISDSDKYEEDELHIYTETDHYCMDMEKFAKDVWTHLKRYVKIIISETRYTPSDSGMVFNEEKWNKMGFTSKFTEHKRRLLA